MQQIERGIFYEDGYLGVTLGGMVFSHGAIMLDAPLRGDDARLWRTTLLSQRSGANRLLVSMDAHPDRTLGARALDCTIAAHQKNAQVFRNRPAIFKGQNNETGAIWETYPEAIGLRWAPPDITFTQSMSLFWGGPEVIMENHSGSAPGAIWVTIPAAKTIFVGDAVVVNQPPFLANADLSAWLESLGLLLDGYQGFVVVSGRGGLASVDAIRAQQQFLLDVVKGIDRIAKHNGAPEETESLIPSLLSGFSNTKELTELYTIRLRYGLYQCYARKYRPGSVLEQPRLEDGGQ